MLPTTKVLALVALTVPLAAAAEEVPGIDLSQPPSEQQPSRGQPAEEPTPRPPPSSAKPKRTDETLESALGAPGERDTALGDRVKAVQRKGFLKRGRLEITPLLAVSLNDPFYQKLGGGLRLAYHLQDSFALAARGVYYTPFSADAVRQAKIALQSQLNPSQLHGQAMLDGIWSPVYGKAAVLASRIVHFDLFLQAGFGAVWSATSLAPRSEGPHIATDFGGGVRFYPLDWAAFEVGLLATLYPDQPDLGLPSTLQKVLTVNVGFSFFLPSHFEYVYP